MGADLGKENNGIDAGERGQDGGALFLRNQRTVWTLELANGGVAVEADDKEVAELFGALEVADVAKMQQIEATVGGDDTFALAPRRSGPASGLLQREHFG